MKKDSLKKKDLVDILASHNPDFCHEDIEEMVGLAFDAMTEALADRRRVEIRGFGNFSVRLQKGREFINPKTGRHTICAPNYRIVFRAGSNLVKLDT